MQVSFSHFSEAVFIFTACCIPSLPHMDLNFGHCFVLQMKGNWSMGVEINGSTE